TLSSKNYSVPPSVAPVNAPPSTNATVTFSYDPNYPRLNSMTDGTGTTYYQYNAISPIPIGSTNNGAGQLVSVDGPLPDDTIVYRYDELGRRVSTSINGVTSTLILDAVNRITNVTNQLGGSGAFVYTYDDIGQKTTMAYPTGQSTVWNYRLGDADRVLSK